jgi:DNA-directed RNA polymerase specialized sigma24 family protein
MPLDRLTASARRRVAALLAEHDPYLVALAKSWAFRPDEADDIAQEARLRLCLWPPVNDTCLRSFIFTVVRGAAADLHTAEYGHVGRIERVLESVRPDRAIGGGRWGETTIDQTAAASVLSPHTPEPLAGLIAAERRGALRGQLELAMRTLPDRQHRTLWPLLHAESDIDIRHGLTKPDLRRRKRGRATLRVTLKRYRVWSQHEDNDT